MGVCTGTAAASVDWGVSTSCAGVCYLCGLWDAALFVWTSVRAYANLAKFACTLNRHQFAAKCFFSFFCTNQFYLFAIFPFRPRYFLLLEEEDNRATAFYCNVNFGGALVAMLWLPMYHRAEVLLLRTRQKSVRLLFFDHKRARCSADWHLLKMEANRTRWRASRASRMFWILDRRSLKKHK